MTLTSIRRRGAVCALAAALWTPAWSAPALAAAPEIKHRSPLTGVATFVVGQQGEAITLPDGSPADAASFLRVYGQVMGIDDPAALAFDRSFRDSLGQTHTTFQQMHAGVPVFSGVIKVHVDGTGAVYAANGDFHHVGSKLDVTPGLDVREAVRLAEAAIGHEGTAVETSDLVIVDPGWYGDPPIGAHLAYHLVLSDPSVPLREALFVDAHDGTVLDRWTMLHTARFREIYDGQGGSSLPGVLARAEGDPPVALDDANYAYDYGGDVYDYFSRAFGRDSIDDMGMTMVLTVNSNYPPCPNAQWNGSQMIFCSGTVTDDITAHEIGHGVTQFTANLIYQNQAGQLNESYSDIFGELIDLFNGDAAFAGPPSGPAWPAHPTGPGQDVPNNLRSVCSFPPTYDDGVRWLMGEDADAFGGSIRDMWDPTCEGDPDRANSPLQTCPGNDNGGVHSGSGIPNHAFAMLTDGKSFNGQVVSPIGPIKAGAVWYRALTTYLTVASDFEDAFAAMNQAAVDLVGTFPNDPRTGLPGDMFTGFDAEQVIFALMAVEMNTEGACGATVNILDPTPPLECGQQTTIFEDDFEGGVNGWTLDLVGAPLNPYDWVQAASLPGGREGTAWYCANIDDGCPAGGEESAVHILRSPAIQIPPVIADPRLRFDHYVATEPGYDGGNLKISVDGGPFELIPGEAFLHNPYNGTLNGGTNTNPIAGQPAYLGVGGGWGTSLVDLSGFVAGGEEIVISYEFGKDWCNGVEGWYVDDFEVYYCTCSTNADCDDGLYCNGEETCNDTLCEPGAAPCGLAYCDESADTCPPTVFWDNFENGNAQGWNLYAPDSQATTGIWEIGDPNGTLSGGAPAQPEFAFEGANCAFTETNGAGGVGDGDVDGGPVYLLSPVIDLSGQASAELRWVRWFYQRDIDDDAGDFFTVEASADGGNNWVAIETLDDFQSENDWNERSALLEDYIGLTADVRVRFGASDGTGDGDIIEAAVDNVAVLLTEEIECLPPSATVVSSRYLSVTPSAVGATVALRVSGAPGDPDVACLDAYVQSDGTLGANPFFQAPAAWGTVNVHGESIIPGATYEVRTECDTGISTLTSAPTSEQLWTWGDVEVNGIVNFADVQLVVQAFQGNFDNVTLEAADLEPCSPNQVVNFADIQRDVQAFQGQTYAQTNCPIPCP